jgi:mono/diheme cytochrome c family protein
MKNLAPFTLLLFSASVLSGADGAGEEFFEKSIRPLFVEHCHECHSSTSKKLKGGLKLDTREDLFTGGDTGPAIIAGDPEASLLIKAVRWSDPDLEMPPKNKLKPEQIAALEKWVKMGAPHTGKATAIAPAKSATSNHWAYQPVLDQQSPRVKDSQWPRHDLDRFILAKLEHKNLRPAALAGRQVLIRRLYFDLIGLPPPPEVLQNENQPIEHLVDQLLDSPQFGEHWARHWLDVVRFAESVTLRGFIFKEAWRYRDYVIDAFNHDRPYDEFLKEQIAGDLMPSESVTDRQRRLIATTFLAVGNWNLEEQDKKALEMDVVDEQLDTIGKAFLGQTIGCARCHDHKFDPIPTRDYYAMAGILRNCRTLTHANVSAWVERPLPLEAAEEAVYREHDAKVSALEAELKSAKDAAKAVAGASGELKPGKDAEQVIARPSDFPGVIVDSARAKPVGAWQHSQYSKRYIGDGYLHDQDKEKGEKSLTFTPELPRAGRYEVRLAYIHAPSRAANVPVTIFHAEGETVVRVNQQEAPSFDGRFASLGQFRFETNGFAYVLVGTEETKGFVTADAVQFIPADQLEPAAGAKADAPATNATARLKELETRLKKLKDSGPKRPMIPSVKEADVIEDAPVHIRGSVHNLGSKVPRGFLSVAQRGESPPMPANQSGRLEFAEWIASAENPLAARVIVNRVWCWLMGDGLVRTVDNFGTTGDLPSHPELLDHLAHRFTREGWSVKKLVREIVLSRAYRQSTDADPAAVAADPENRLYGRMSRRRLPAEAIRDAMLSVSGELHLLAGGRTFPETRAADYGFECTEPRRSVYVPVFRNALPEIFEVFDFAAPGMVVGRRNTSTVPTQALFLLNHPFVHDRARVAAERIAKSFSDSTAQIQHAWWLTLGRPPTDRELRLTLDSAAPLPDVIHALIASIEFRYVN